MSPTRKLTLRACFPFPNCNQLIICIICMRKHNFGQNLKQQSSFFTLKKGQCHPSLMTLSP